MTKSELIKKVTIRRLVRDIDYVIKHKKSGYAFRHRRYREKRKGELVSG